MSSSEDEDGYCYAIEEGEEECEEEDDEYDEEKDEDELLYISYSRSRNNNTDNDETENEYEANESNYREDNTADPDDTPPLVEDYDYNNNPTGFNDLYDIFRIHMSNQQAFGAMSSNQTQTNDQYPGLNPNNIYNYPGYTYNNININSLNENAEYTCPICNETMLMSQITSHVLYDHSRFFVYLSMSLNPAITIDEIQNIYNMVRPPVGFNYVNDGIGGIQRLRGTGSSSGTDIANTVHNLMFNNDDDDDHDPSYEDLLRLCDYMGYHKPGVSNIDLVAPVTETDQLRERLCEDDTCRICLETLLGDQILRKINMCSHVFCSECLEQWLKENKTCPLCNGELVCEEHNNVTRTRPETSLEDVD